MALTVLALTLVASNLPYILLREGLGLVSLWLVVAKLVVLVAAAVYFCRVRNLGLSRYATVLAGIIAAGFLTWFVGNTGWWQTLFNSAAFTGNFGGAITLKLVSTLPVVALLLLLFGRPHSTYLVWGDLSVKAEPVRWLGINRDMISWGKLSVISAFAIAGGTLLLTLITTTGFSAPDRIGDLPRHLPLILLLALVNSVSEGFIFRNAVLGPLRGILPKNQLLLIAAAFFGLAHYYGVPSGPLGVVMSGLLGWYLAKSMYETGGLLCAWIIHFMQDVVIFTTIFLLSGLA